MPLSDARTRRRYLSLYWAQIFWDLIMVHRLIRLTGLPRVIKHKLSTTFEKFYRKKPFKHQHFESKRQPFERESNSEQKVLNNF